jgi:cyclophilin family peptidyl-prolyl cis-trans isomerase
MNHSMSTMRSWNRLKLESLEARDVPHSGVALSLMDVPGSDFPVNKPLYVPITAMNSLGENISYSVTSTNANIAAEVVTGGRSVRFTVSGTSGEGSSATPFEGTFTIRLFEESAPLATANIVKLVEQDYYVNKLFHRVVNDFVIQGGSPNGDGQGGSSLITDAPDEFNTQFTFASRGIVAMANAGDDNNNAQFFITDPFILDGTTEVPAPLDRRSQFLNFNHTIIGILTSGFDTYQTVMDVKKTNGNDGAISKPVNNVTITKTELIDDTTNGVIKITALNDKLETANISVSGNHEGNIDDVTFEVTAVTDTVNDRPFLGTLGNISTPVGTPTTVNIPFTELDSEDSVTFTAGRVVSTANGPTFTTLDPTQATLSVSQDGKVTITPAAGFRGILEVTVGVRDQQDRVGSSLGLNDARNFDTQKFTVNVGGASNSAPSITARVGNQSTTTGTVAGPFGFSINDAETAAESLTVTATSSNTTLLPNSSIVLGGSGRNRTITLNPAAGQNGTAQVTITVTDADGLTGTDTFTFTVTTPGNTAPTLDNFSNVSVAVGSSIAPINFTVGDAETALDALTITATSSNSTLFPEANVLLEGSGANRTLTLTAASGQSGTATITVRVEDEGALSVTKTFTVNVVPPASIVLSANKTSTSTGRPVLFTATVSNATGSVITFLDGTNVIGTVRPADNKAYFSTTFNDNASHTITARVTPTTGAAVESSPVTITNTSSVAPITITAEGSAFGTPNKITAFNADGSVRFTKSPYGTFTGVVRVKVADVTGDGQLDVVGVPGFGGGPHIVVYDGNTGDLVYQNMIYGENFRGGLSLDTGDANALGYAQLLVGAGDSGGPRVTLLDVSKQSTLLDYFAYDSASRGGVSVSIADLRGGNVPNIITGAGVGQSPTVKVYNPFAITNQTPAVFGSFQAGTTTSGLRVSAGPLLEDNTRRDILVSNYSAADTASSTQSFNPITSGVFVG